MKSSSPAAGFAALCVLSTTLPATASTDDSAGTAMPQVTVVAERAAEG